MFLQELIVSSSPSSNLQVEAAVVQVVLWVFLVLKERVSMTVIQHQVSFKYVNM